MTAYKLEKNVPITSYRATKAELKYPLAGMQSGDSFTVDLSKKASVRSTVFNYQRGTNKRFITRTVRENGKYLVRVWRTL
jgi:hypothetical protein